jgi:hypothetical protein
MYFWNKCFIGMATSENDMRFWTFLMALCCLRKTSLCVHFKQACRVVVFSNNNSRSCMSHVPFWLLRFELREVGTAIDDRHSTFEYRTGAYVEPALTPTFGKSPEYRAGTNDELVLTSTCGKSPEYRAGANVEPGLTSTFGTCHEYWAEANVEPALTSTFCKSLEYRTGANAESALTSTFGHCPEYRAGPNVEPALTSTFGKNP